ncbi:MAG TPA: YceI family protein [Longimicrobium sp.]|jgi:polyisoprenoid-binding protein YceI
MHRLTAWAAALAVAAPLGAQPAAAPPPEYRIDAGHSRIEFSIPFMYLPVRGRFNDVRGTLLYDPAAPERSSVTAVIATRSIDTGSGHRDEHLRSADFFDAERYPTIVFTSRSVRRAGRALAMTGPLTMHGVTRPVTVRFRPLAPPVADPHGSNIVTFAGEVRVSRKEFGILGGSRFNEWFDAVRSATMGDSVTITLEVSGWATDFLRKHDAQLDSAVARTLRAGGSATAARMREAARRNPDAFRGQEWDIDQVAGALLARRRFDNALEILKLNAEIFPRSSAARASVATAYERQGDRAQALAWTRQALALDATDTRAMELLKRLGG